MAVQPAANKVDAMKNFIVLLYITSYDKGKDYYIDVAMTMRIYIWILSNSLLIIVFLIELINHFIMI